MGIELPLAYLERYAEAGGPVERIPLLALPFIIGRSEQAGHTIYSNKVSREHAAIVVVGDQYAVRDLQSTNGTFVNGRRTAEHVLHDGDIIHIAHVEFAFHCPQAHAQLASTVPRVTRRWSGHKCWKRTARRASSAAPNCCRR